MRTAHRRQNTLDYGEMVMEWRLDEPRKVYPVRLEPTIAEAAKTIGRGNLSLGIRLAIFREKERHAATAPKKDANPGEVDQTESTPTSQRKKRARTTKKTPKPAKAPKRPAKTAKKTLSGKSKRPATKSTRKKGVSPKRKRPRRS